MSRSQLVHFRSLWVWGSGKAKLAFALYPAYALAGLFYRFKPKIKLSQNQDRPEKPCKKPPLVKLTPQPP